MMNSLPLDEGLLMRVETIAAKIRFIVHEAEGMHWLPDKRLELLKAFAYDAEDVLDEIATLSLRRRIESQSQTIDCIDAGSINSRMQSILDKYDDMKQVCESCQRRRFRGAGAGGGAAKYGEKRYPMTPIGKGGVGVFGRDKAKEEILELLMSSWPGEPDPDDSDPDDPDPDDPERSRRRNAIAIVGMGGMGKTTLANLLYTDPRVKEHFDIQAWVRVSQEIEPIRVIEVILEMIGSSSPLGGSGTDDRHLLACGLKESVRGKKFLIVLDDVWNENSWDSLLDPLHSGGAGSRILVTTRSTNVALAMGAAHTHYLDALSFEDGLSMFMRLVLKNTKYRHGEFGAVGGEIVRWCQGLPLAIEVVAYQVIQSEWKHVLMFETWRDQLFPTLMLSYLDLPCHLRRCFSYCSIFPKNYLYEKEKLVLLWMAEGLVSPQGNLTMEQVADSYFEQLLFKSFFRQTTINGKSYFIMHPLINDIARVKSGELSCRVENNAKTMRGGVSELTRHLSCFANYFDASQIFESVVEAKHLRTFLASQGHFARRRVSCRAVHNLVVELKYLRALSLEGYAITELPDSIGELKHLRYLDLSETMIHELPESVCNLYNLQTLILAGCKSLSKLPSKMGNLVNLRHLDTRGSSVEEMSSGILSKLKDLRISRSNEGGC